MDRKTQYFKEVSFLPWKQLYREQYDRIFWNIIYLQLKGSNVSKLSGMVNNSNLGDFMTSFYIFEAQVNKCLMFFTAQGRDAGWPAEEGGAGRY